MTGVTSGQTPLATATDSDFVESYNTGALVTALQTVANKFESATGHAHAGSGQGAPIGVSSLAAAVGNFGAAAAFTPGLQQSGAVTTSAATGFYIQIGKLVFFTATLTASAAGTAGNAIVVTGLPVASQQRGMGGIGDYRLGSTGAHYRLTSSWNNATSLVFNGADNVTASFGSNPAVTIGSGDSIIVSGWYEST